MINKIAILGSGTMGQGLARLFVRHGLQTTLYDPVPDALLAAKRNLQIFQDGLSQTASVSRRDGLACTHDLEEAVTGTDLIIESAPEELEIKRALYRRVGAIVKPDTIVTSNTSTYPLSALSDQQVFANRMIITHFFNPADVIPLVEIVQVENTTPGIVESIAALLRNCGKVPVILKKDITGFVANRLQAAVLREACFLVENGIVDPGQVDTVMKESVGMRWAVTGPFQVADYGGLDVWKRVLANLLPLLSNTSEVPLIVRQKVEQHQLGVKTGSGFFDYTSAGGKEQSADWTRKLLKLLKLRS